MFFSLQLENIRIPLKTDHPDEEALSRARKKLRRLSLSLTECAWHIRKRSVDARKKSDILWVYSVQCDAEGNHLPPSDALAREGIKVVAHPSLSVSQRLSRRVKISVVGFGPAGMFCALLLAENGYAPTVYERGDNIENRVLAVQKFLETGVLDEESNIQFGAGGAGTFSDGKLTTRINDPLCEYVMKRLVDFGAPSEILYKAKPHIGTDHLRVVVQNLEKHILSLGGRVLYRSRVEEIDDDSLVVNGLRVPSDRTVLAIGHSARDIYRFLLDKDYEIQPKAFSCGVRIEHLQKDLDEAMYGPYAGLYGLEHADYNLSYREGNRGVYSFCMCPGGVVMASASENETIVTNGMSNYARDGLNANAALNVSVLPEDYGDTPQGAILFQSQMEKAAYVQAGRNGKAPMQLMGDFLSGSSGKEPKRILPSYRDGWVSPVDLHAIFPSFMTDLMETGFRYFGHKIRGFSDPDVPLTGVETRTSAPVRIVRGENLSVKNHPSVYPCGEGAGYAGGIISAAVDGLRVALALMDSSL